ncbi:U3 snoRNP protein [Lithohypha guttulata]|nr:U3 snoRNP protein [Lithohypha guttulata]
MAAAVVNGSHHAFSLTTFLEHEPQQFLQPTLEHQQAAVAAVKAILDPLASHVVDIQTSRRNENRRKRKRGSDETNDPVLQLRQIYTNGVPVKQVWEQARRVLDAACAEIELGIDEHLQQHGASGELLDGNVSQDGVGYEHDDMEVDGGMEIDEDDDTGSDPEEEDIKGDLEVGGAEEEEDIEDDIDVEQDMDEDMDEDFHETPQSTYRPDPNNLNDGFFSIDDFNKQSQFLEQMDARGDDDNPSDEDEVDWDADPLAQPSQKSRTSRDSRKQEPENEDTEDEEGGPTFGNADLHAPETDEGDANSEIDGGELDGMMYGLVNTNDIRYADFFEPPPKKPSKSKRTRALPKTQPPPVRNNTGADQQEQESDLERAMADVRRDLLDSDEEVDEDEEEVEDDSDVSDSDALPRLSASKIKDKNLSTHEKQRLQIAEEIRRLEALNVSKKPWTLSGEASAQARPLNSLVEEDLDFERTGKPVPVITAEISTDIEALIKRRILARDFDEVVRRRPTSLDSAADARRGRADVVVDDTKSKVGLGEVYESEYQRKTDPTSYVDSRSAATKKQHQDIDKLWKEVRDQLDILANLHIKPKRTEIEIKTVEDKPRIAMEDARPTISSGIDDNGTMLAPQEIYKPGTDSRAATGEVLSAKSGETRSKEEMTREEKIRRRRREKERLKKAGQQKQNDSTGQAGKSTKRSEQAKVLKDLQKGGAKVIGKDGQLRELSAKKNKGDKDASRTSTVSGGAMKL